jgi:NAD(P)-dependent dehydrogenase (short-subunit alcohol dehydrogenase family)
MNIAGKTILITGANRGIGLALVEEALRRSAKKVYATTRGVFRHDDARVTPVSLDVTRAADIQRLSEEIESLDILINNAGLALYDDLGDPAMVERQLAVNLFGPLNVTRALLPLLKRTKGAIVNNLSLAGIAPMPVIPGYSLSKAAAANLTQSQRALLAKEGVTVHAVFIGPTDTDMNRGLRHPESHDGDHGPRHLRWTGERRGGHLPGSFVPGGRRGLAQQRGQGHGAPVRRIHARHGAGGLSSVRGGDLRDHDGVVTHGCARGQP